jgi:hypothetical protein
MQSARRIEARANGIASASGEADRTAYAAEARRRKAEYDNSAHDRPDAHRDLGETRAVRKPQLAGIDGGRNCAQALFAGGDVLPGRASPICSSNRVVLRPTHACGCSRVPFGQRSRHARFTLPRMSELGKVAPSQ